MRTRKSGFTLIELLVVIAIIAILVALLLPAVQQVREAARKSQCQDHLHNLVIALHGYEGDAKSFPPGGFTSGFNVGTGMSWHVSNLPYIEQKPLYDRFSFNVTDYLGTAPGAPSNGAARYNLQWCIEPIDLFLCPSGTKIQITGNQANENFPNAAGQTPSTTHYYGVLGPKGLSMTGRTYGVSNGAGNQGGWATGGILLKREVVSMSDIKDGTSNTLMLGEISWDRADVYRAWNRGAGGNASGAAVTSAKNIQNPINSTPYNGGTTASPNQNFNDVSFGSQHPGGAQFSLADGKVTFLSENIDMRIYKALGSRKGTEAARVP